MMIINSLFVLLKKNKVLKKTLMLFISILFASLTFAQSNSYDDNIDFPVLPRSDEEFKQVFVFIF